MGRESSPLFSYLLPGTSPNKKRHVDVQGVAEVFVVMSSDEELDLDYRTAKKHFRDSGATICDSPRPHRSPTPSPSSPSDFECDTPKPLNRRISSDAFVSCSPTDAPSPNLNPN
mmetsp:Transcript_110788/g.192045  ORF Transcript_110788/g.192045 Transcript_110788/m.192045 type:complete len:114 (-) Transcript_110788:591-932(-)